MEGEAFEALFEYTQDTFFDSDDDFFSHDSSQTDGRTQTAYHLNNSESGDISDQAFHEFNEKLTELKGNYTALMVQAKNLQLELTSYSDVSHPANINLSKGEVDRLLREVGRISSKATRNTLELIRIEDDVKTGGRGVEDLLKKVAKYESELDRASKGFTKLTERIEKIELRIQEGLRREI